MDTCGNCIAGAIRIRGRATLQMIHQDNGVEMARLVSARIRRKKTVICQPIVGFSANNYCPDCGGVIDHQRAVFDMMREVLIPPDGMVRCCSCGGLESVENTHVAGRIEDRLHCRACFKELSQVSFSF